MLKRLWSSRRIAAGALIQWSGAGHAYEAVRRPEGAVILMYHSVSKGSADAYIDPVNRMPPDVFERQMAFLS
ncbi:MAG: hypothetical protein M3Y55_15025, partial [Pseudomonadota bacterium]|nr:hypothetical protein [Pseudomonadota bacterium]